MSDSEGRTDVTRLLEEIEQGRPNAADELLPVLYDELKRLARARVARERDPRTPEPTSLVHQAYLRLVGDGDARWANRAHFFAAASEAMRRILVESARGRLRLKRGGRDRQVTLNEREVPIEARSEDLLTLDLGLTKLEQQDPSMARLVKLRYYAGLTQAETAAALGVSERTVNRTWLSARAWLLREMGRKQED